MSETPAVPGEQEQHFDLLTANPVYKLSLPLGL